MFGERPSQYAFYGEPESGERAVNDHYKRYKDHVMANLKTCNISRQLEKVVGYPFKLATYLHRHCSKHISHSKERQAVEKL